MENIRAFFDYVGDFITEKINKKQLYESYGYLSLPNIDYTTEREYIENIANKLFAMNKEDRPIYAKLVIECLDSWYSAFDSYEEVKIGEDVICPEDETCQRTCTIYIQERDGIKYDMSCVASDISFFVYGVLGLLLDFGIDTKALIDALKGQCKYNSYEELEQINNNAINNPGVDLRFKRISKKPPKAKTTEQVDVIRTFIKSAGVEYNNDTALAKFISWLCGGTEDSIRKNGIVPNTGYGNEDTLKRQFSSIGIDYNKGFIKKTLM